MYQIYINRIYIVVVLRVNYTYLIFIIIRGECLYIILYSIIKLLICNLPPIRKF